MKSIGIAIGLRALTRGLLTRGLAALSLVCALTASAGTAVLINSVVPLTTTDQVRVDVDLLAREPADRLDVYGFITHGKSGNILWQGTLAKTNLAPGQRATLSATVKNLRPELWEPENPALYRLKVIALRGGRTVGETKLFFGFRSMEVRSGQFFLNDRPIFLRGVAINPPGHSIPEKTSESRAFAEAYVKFLKSQNVNILGLASDAPQTWFDVCDQQGMLLYVGRYGAPPAMDKKTTNGAIDSAAVIAAYQKLLVPCASHPSVILYHLASELPVAGETGRVYSELLTKAYHALQKWDGTRAYICNAGYGEGREGDVCDVHRYWGWYYNSFLTYYNLREHLSASPVFGDSLRKPPITFTECVGAFTGASGEFNLVREKQLAPRLGWIGHTADPATDSTRYQSFLIKQATESFRRMRPLNSRLAGIMPFTVLFDNWSGIERFDQMKPKPAMAQLAASFQPVLLSWELWTPQVYAGAQLRPVVHVVNDHPRGAVLTGAKLQYELRTGNQVVESFEEPLPDVRYYQAWAKPIPITLRKELATGEYVLAGAIVHGTNILSTNWTEVFIAGQDWKALPSQPARELMVYDPSGETASALEKTRVEFRKAAKFTDTVFPKPGSGLVIGENAWNETLAPEIPRLREFVKNGGRILILQQTNGFDASWLPAQITFLESSPNDMEYPPRKRPFREQMNVNPERPAHPVFAGLSRDRLRLWSDYTGWDQTQAGFPAVYPVTSGFKLERPNDLAVTAILADYDHGLEAVALCEMFDGQGSVMVSGLDLVKRAGADPAADRLLSNLITYLGSGVAHELHPLVEGPIRWGNFASEKGLVCGSLNGLLVNAEWVRPTTNPKAKPLPPNTGSSTLMPGEQFIPEGRNPFGEFTYTTASGLRDASPGSAEGSGFFLARLPEGRKQLVTVVRNPGTNALSLKISLDPDAEGHATTVPGGQTLRIRVPLPEKRPDVYVRYSGDKSLVLLETAFE